MFDIATCTALGPAASRTGPLAASDRLVVGEASHPPPERVRLLSCPGPEPVHQTAQPSASMTRSATRLDVSTLPAATAAPGRALRIDPSAAAITSIGRWAPADGGPSGSVSTLTANGTPQTGHRKGAVEVALDLAVAATGSQASTHRQPASTSTEADQSYAPDEPSSPRATSSALLGPSGRPCQCRCGSCARRRPGPRRTQSGRHPSHGARSTRHPSPPMRLAAPCARRSAILWAGLRICSAKPARSRHRPTAVRSRCPRLRAGASQRHPGGGRSTDIGVMGAAAAHPRIQSLVPGEKRRDQGDVRAGGCRRERGR